jgi:hypothetical protein
LVGGVLVAELGLAVLVSDALPTWLGWTGVRVGTRLGRRSGGEPVRQAVQPALLAHLYTGTVDVVLLLD